MTESTKKIGAGLPGNANFRQSDLLAGQAVTWDFSLQKWVAGVPAAGVTDHVNLTNIGTNTHAQLDTHVAAATLHFVLASIEDLFNSSVAVARSLAASAGGLEVKNEDTGGGFERVLTTSDLGAISDPLTLGQIIITDANALDLVDEDVALVIGTVAGDHLELGIYSTGTGIQGKASATTVDTLFIQPLGGDVFLGPSAGAAVAGATKLRAANGSGDGGTVIEVTTSGMILEGRTGTNTILDYHLVNGNLATRLIMNSANFIFDGHVDSMEFQFQSDDAGSVKRQLLHLDPDAGVQIYHPPTAIVRLETTALGHDSIGTIFNLGQASDSSILFKMTNSIGGIRLILASSSGDAQINQLDSDGDFEQTFMRFLRGGNVQLGQNLDMNGLDILMGGGDIDTEGSLTITNDDADFIIRDTTDGTTNYFYRDHSAGTLKIGTPDAVVTLRSSLDLDDEILDPDKWGRVTVQFDSINDVTMSDIPGMSVAIVSGNKYEFEGYVYCESASATPDIKLDTAGGSPTESQMVYSSVDINEVTAQDVKAPISGNFTIPMTANAQTIVRFKGQFKAGNGGPLRIRASQNTSNGTASSVLVGSWVRIRRIT